MQPLTHKERTENLRNALKVYGLHARVSKYQSCGVNWIKVAVPKYDSSFSSDDLEKIAIAARANKLTFARGIEVTIDFMRQMTGRKQFDFVFKE